jgi:outer membrane biosynthesis protein TonB
LAGVLRSSALDWSVAADVHLEAFDRLFSAERNGEAEAVLAQLETLPGIGADHPARADLAARRALLALAGGDAAASALLAGSGPAAASACRVPPQHRRGSGSNNDFPDAALAWGFAGWTAAEAQIDAAGRPNPVRTVVAYPPFVFGEAAEGMIRRFRFAPAPEPGGSACVTFNQRIRFELPGPGAD